MSINCLIVEDEPLARSLMVDYVKKVPSLNMVAACSSALDAMEILRKESVDLILLDIQMPEITGISFLKTLHKKPMVIFTTAYSEYALEGYELDVVDYLLKPVTFERFLKGIDKAAQRLKLSTHSSVSIPQTNLENAPDFVFVKDGTKLVKIRLKDILYVEGMKDYVTIYTTDQKVTSLQRLKSMEEQLPDNQFVRIHHSYIVNMAAIDSIYKNEVHIGKASLPISESYRKSFKDFVDGKQMQ